MHSRLAISPLDESKEVASIWRFYVIIMQTTSKWQTRDAKLIPNHRYLEEMIENFEVTSDYLPRAQNYFIDALATLSSLL